MSKCLITFLEGATAILFQNQAYHKSYLKLVQQLWSAARTSWWSLVVPKLKGGPSRIDLMIDETFHMHLGKSMGNIFALRSLLTLFRSTFFTYKKYFSVVLLAMADADLRIQYAKVGAETSCSDSRIFSASELLKVLEYTSGNTVQTPYFLLADVWFGSAVECSSHTHEYTYRKKNGSSTTGTAEHDWSWSVPLGVWPQGK